MRSVGFSGSQVAVPGSATIFNLETHLSHSAGAACLRSHRRPRGRRARRGVSGGRHHAAADDHRELVHTLETLRTGARLGEQRSEIITENDRLRFEVVTSFDDGTVSEDSGEMDISDGYRALSFRRVNRKHGVVDAEERVDFLSGHVEWTIGGVRQEQTFSFAPDTYAGPMLALVLAAVPQRPDGHASFQMITFRPDPRVYTIQVDVVDRGMFDLVSTPTPATKLG